MRLLRGWSTQLTLEIIMPEFWVWITMVKVLVKKLWNWKPKMVQKSASGLAYQVTYSPLPSQVFGIICDPGWRQSSISMCTTFKFAYMSWCPLNKISWCCTPQIPDSEFGLLLGRRKRPLLEGHSLCAGLGSVLICKSPGGTGNEVVCSWSGGKDDTQPTIHGTLLSELKATRQTISKGTEEVQFKTPGWKKTHEQKANTVWWQHAGYQERDLRASTNLRGCRWERILSNHQGLRTPRLPRATRLTNRGAQSVVPRPVASLSTRELVRNAESWVPFQTYSQNPWEGAAQQSSFSWASRWFSDIQVGQLLRHTVELSALFPAGVSSLHCPPSKMYFPWMPLFPYFQGFFSFIHFFFLYKTLWGGEMIKSRSHWGLSQWRPWTLPRHSISDRKVT